MARRRKKEHKLTHHIAKHRKVGRKRKSHKRARK